MLCESWIVRTIAILNPIPSSPSKFSLGRAQSSNIRLHVDDAFIPSFFSLAPNDSPSTGLGNIKQLIPYKEIHFISKDIENG